MVKLPWVREGSGFTLLFEAMAFRVDETYTFK
ncbi:MAG: transposase family protein [Candidatus Gracilibacteria bacterium]|nr:transposase family protein [Candidatus Gracilibacteria bacterium]